MVEGGNKVTGITGDNDHVKDIEKFGATAVVLNVLNTDELIEIFEKGKRLYLLNPPAPINSNTSKEEHKNLSSILAAIKRVSFEKIVAESTYGVLSED